MFEFLKRFSPSEHKRFHSRGHGHGRTGPRQEIFTREGAALSEAGVSQCPFCEKHCLLNDPGCRKGAAFAMQQFPPVKGA
jgi:hypothetical protein